MDDAILAKIRQKASECMGELETMGRLARSVGNERGFDPVLAGVVAGRMYNSFYYQTRRVRGRDPTPGEFEEFLDVVNDALLSAGGAAAVAGACNDGNDVDESRN